MSILSAQSINARISRAESIKRLEAQGGIGYKRELNIQPYVPDTKQFLGKSYGLTAAGYDIRLGKLRHPRRSHALVEALHLRPGEFMLAASLEKVTVPNDLQVIVHDKSSWARKGLALQNTVLEPGWEGYITLELSNHGTLGIELKSGMPIAQLVFHELDFPTEKPYTGKYQNQGSDPQEAIDHPGHEDAVDDTIDNTDIDV